MHFVTIVRTITKCLCQNVPLKLTGRGRNLLRVVPPSMQTNITFTLSQSHLTKGRCLAGSQIALAQSELRCSVMPSSLNFIIITLFSRSTQVNNAILYVIFYTF